MNHPSPIDRAIIDGDVELVALLYRNERMSKELEKLVRKDGADVELQPWEMLLGIVAPPEIVRERSLEKARELIEVGPFVWRKAEADFRVCQREGCNKRFEPFKAKKFCSADCRKRNHYTTTEAAYRSSRAYLSKVRTRRAQRTRGNIARGWDFLKEYKCQGGHERTPQNTFVDQGGRRRCRDCMRYSRRRRAYAFGATSRRRPTPIPESVLAGRTPSVGAAA